MTTQKARAAVESQQWDGGFERFYEQTFGLAVGVARKKLRRTELAEDVAQEALLRTWLRQERLTSRTHGQNSVCKISNNLCKDILASAAYRKERPHDGDYADPSRRGGATPLELLVATEQRAVVREALAKLSPADRDLLLMRDVDELPPAEIAAILLVTEWAVNTRVLRARRRLRKLLEPYFPEYTTAGVDGA